LDAMGSKSAVRTWRVSKTQNCRGGLYETLTNLLPDEGIVCVGVHLKCGEA